jgi:hypothetical protein
MTVLQSLFIVYLMADNSLNPALSLFSHLTIIGEFFIVGVVHSNNLVKYKVAMLKIPRIYNEGRAVAQKKTLPGGSVLSLVWSSGQSRLLRQLLVSTRRASR